MDHQARLETTERLRKALYDDAKAELDQAMRHDKPLETKTTQQESLRVMLTFDFMQLNYRRAIKDPQQLPPSRRVAVDWLATSGDTM